jgi:biotin synthase
MDVGNYLTALGRCPEADLELLADPRMPVESLGATL